VSGDQQDQLRWVTVKSNFSCQRRQPLKPSENGPEFLFLKGIPPAHVPFSPFSVLQ